MSEQINANFPDLLGIITGGTRLNIDMVQCALAVRPPRAHAGHPLELIVLLQNTSDSEIDIVIVPELPSRDLARQKNCFSAKSTRIVCGLEPAHVGFVTLPITVAPTTKPGHGYTIGVKLAIKQLKKNAQRIRAIEGGGQVLLENLPEATRTRVQSLRLLDFSHTLEKKKLVETTFTIYPPEPLSLKNARQDHANWVSLWTLRDHSDDYLIAAKVWDTAQQAIAKFNRTTLFMPLLKTTQERFAACQYALLPPEAIFIAKLLTLKIETEIEKPSTLNPRPKWPKWFTTLCRVLIREPGLVNQIEPLVTRLLYNDLIHDAVTTGFASITAVTGENFGSQDEINDYADSLTTALIEEEPLDLARAYLPMVMGGLIANTRVTMPREKVRETVFVLSKALQKRQPERDANNAFIFEVTQDLIDRALDTL